MQKSATSMPYRNPNNQGFTFVETLVAVALLGIVLAASLAIGQRFVSTREEETERIRFLNEAVQLTNFLRAENSTAQAPSAEEKPARNPLWEPVLGKSESETALPPMPPGLFPNIEISQLDERTIEITSTTNHTLSRHLVLPFPGLSRIPSAYPQPYRKLQ